MDVLLFLLPILYAFVGYVVIVGVIALIIYRNLCWEQRRSDALRPVAEELGLTFIPRPQAPAIDTFAGFELFSKGRSRRIGKVRFARMQDTEVSIFDYSYCSRRRCIEPERSFHQTVICFESGSLNLPRFALKPKVAAREHGIFIVPEVQVPDLGLREVRFDVHPEFSRRYHLAGEDEAAVRWTFSAPVLEQLEQIAGGILEGNGSQLLLYRPGKYVGPDQIGPFLREAFVVFRALAFQERGDRD
jgi:hypothetical protein